MAKEKKRMGDFTKAEWNAMSLEEQRKYAPKHLNKLGEYYFSGVRNFYDVHLDMRAVLK